MKKIWIVLLVIVGVVIVFGGMVIAGLNKPVILDEQVIMPGPRLRISCRGETTWCRIW